MSKKTVSLFFKHKNRSFQNEIVIGFMGLLLCVVLIFLVTVANFIVFLNNHFTSYSEEIIKQAGIQVENALYRMELSRKQVLVSFCDSAFYDVHATANQRYISGRDLLDSMATTRRNNDDIENIHVYVSSIDTLYSAETVIGKAKKVRAQMVDFLKSESTSYCELRYNNKTGEVEGVNFYSSIYALEPRGYKIAALCIELKSEAIFGVLDQIDVESSQQVYLIDSEGRIFYDRAGDYTESNTTELANVEQNTSKISFGNKRMAVSYRISPMNWKLVVLFEYITIFWRMSKGTFLILCFCCTVIVLLFVLWAMKKSRRLAAPINEIVSHLEKYPQNGERLLMLKPKNADIAVLVESYNRLIQRIEMLHQTNLSEERARIDAEYKALIRQINPHFLLNSMESLRGEAILYNAPELSQSINALSQMLRYNLDDRGDNVTLRDELRNLENYLVVVRNRINYEIDLQYEIDEEVLDCRVIKFLLQPIVENSIRHAELASAKPRAIILVSAKKYTNILEIKLKDNGKGIPSNKLQTLNLVLALKETNSIYARGSGIGLDNITKRLHYTFGEQAEISVTSEEEIGTEVTIRIDYGENSSKT